MQYTWFGTTVNEKNAQRYTSLQYVSMGIILLPCTYLFLRRLRSIHSLKLKHSTMTMPIGYLNFLFWRKLNSACSSRSATAKDTNVATEFLHLKKKVKQQTVSSLESLLGTLLSHSSSLLQATPQCSVFGICPPHFLPYFFIASPDYRVVFSAGILLCTVSACSPNQRRSLLLDDGPPACDFPPVKKKNQRKRNFKLPKKSYMLWDLFVLGSILWCWKTNFSPPEQLQTCGTEPSATCQSHSVQTIKVPCSFLPSLLTLSSQPCWLCQSELLELKPIFSNEQVFVSNWALGQCCYAIWCRRLEPVLLQGFFHGMALLGLCLQNFFVRTTAVPRPTFLLSYLLLPTFESKMCMEANSLATVSLKPSVVSRSACMARLTLLAVSVDTQGSPWSGEGGGMAWSAVSWACGGSFSSSSKRCFNLSFCLSRDFRPCFWELQREESNLIKLCMLENVLEVSNNLPPAWKYILNFFSCNTAGLWKKIDEKM